jgi:hypothetical protein
VVKEPTRLNTIVKAWETYHALAAGHGEAALKLRSMYLAAAFALVAFGFTKDEPLVYLFAVFAALVFSFLEAGIRRIQKQYFEKIKEIETTINDFLAGDEAPRFPESGVRTDLDLPDIWSLFEQFRLRRFLFWSPYAVTSGVAILLWRLSVTAASMSDARP